MEQKIGETKEATAEQQPEPVKTEEGGLVEVSVKNKTPKKKQKSQD
jgi:hypothetical protein